VSSSEDEVSSSLTSLSLTILETILDFYLIYIQNEFFGTVKGILHVLTYILLPLSVKPGLITKLKKKRYW
jgi:hypothetical protein